MEYLNPSVNKIMGLFHLNKVFTKGESYYIFDGKQRYTDFIAQYGALPLGYNHEEIWQSITQFKEDKTPSLCQPSIPLVTQELASQLTNLFPGDLNICTFAQSGAESIEAAIKLARAKTKKEKILSCHKGFHGKTLGALSATGQAQYQEPFFIQQDVFLKIPYNDLLALQEALERHSEEIAAFIVEPIQGEGGVRIPHKQYLSKAIELCRQYDVLVIVDEIQTGLGRLGNWSVTTEENLLPDMVTLSKALGGGLVPISVCISRSSIWTEDFGFNHSSTFANNNFTSSVSLSFINYLKKNDELFTEVKQKGSYFKAKLEDIHKKWPCVIREVRGNGLMLAVEFEVIDAGDSFEIANMTSAGGIGYLLSGYLLNVHQIRVMPFLNDSLTIRIQPPLIINKQEIDRFIEVFNELCEILYRRDFYLIYRYTTGDYRKPEFIKDYRHYYSPIISSLLDESDKPKTSFAFLCHYPSPQDLVTNTPSFERFSDHELSKIFEWQADYSGAGVLCHMPSVRTPAGGYAEGWLIGLTYGGKEILERPRNEVVTAIKKGIKLAKELGANVVGLGAYTSIVTRGGYDLLDQNITLTTGNTLTIITAVEALIESAKKKGHDINTAKIGILGANGSIGKKCAMILAQTTSNITLIGRNSNPTKNIERLKQLANLIYVHALCINEEDEGVRKEVLSKLELMKGKNQLNNTPSTTAIEQVLMQKNPGEEIESINVIDEIEEVYKFLKLQPPIHYSVEIKNEISNLDMMITATSSMEEIIPVDQIKYGAIICDVSRPANVGPLVKELRKDVLVIEGGLVQYPEPISFGQNLGYKPGVNLACLSETMLLALENEKKNFGIGGRITMEDIYYIQKIAKKHQFTLAELDSLDLSTEMVKV
ncbi:MULTISPECIES: aminotransferase class III-fold pyridoxal phosphate-dependent enzyme [Metabacillus]|uniref:Aminotransferase class III-fold pyridoxal phosphate-dependent enzyme n=2 Tax=Metabacillus TaxID=2675233 RepID=A0A179T3K6_9BACI|nr:MULTISPECIES: aminotransferase class III-fold pyridoxal phosphate-dependent enzyme [Metabacillus]OAS88284.1 hypothetical protein A6K24_16385 [Metabacillus litoralis]QNF28009.1 aminotransferase class III-fold pyridoxal phosphate-dependent enzyme [Metabacillus sp. KUDC1714]